MRNILSKLFRAVVIVLPILILVPLGYWHGFFIEWSACGEAMCNFFEGNAQVLLTVGGLVVGYGLSTLIKRKIWNG